MRACTGSDSSRFRSRPRGSRGASCWISSARSRAGRRRRSSDSGRSSERAWGSRDDLPADELNGVVPLDSKFGFAWRDWRVLSELADRTGRADFAKAAARIAAILGERAADKRIETLQDRIHRLYAWWLFDKEAFASKIKRETGALLALQNADGGWHEVDYRAGPERRLHDRSARLDPASDRPAARPSGRRQGAPLPAGPAAGFRRLVPDHHARELPHSDARDAVRRDGPGRSVSSTRQSAAGMG